MSAGTSRNVNVADSSIPAAASAPNRRSGGDAPSIMTPIAKPSTIAVVKITGPTWGPPTRRAAGADTRCSASQNPRQSLSPWNRPATCPGRSACPKPKDSKHHAERHHRRQRRQNRANERPLRKQQHNQHTTERDRQAGPLVAIHSTRKCLVEHRLTRSNEPGVLCSAHRRAAAKIAAATHLDPRFDIVGRPSQSQAPRVGFFGPRTASGRRFASAWACDIRACSSPSVFTSPAGGLFWLVRSLGPQVQARFFPVPPPSVKSL